MYLVVMKNNEKLYCGETDQYILDSTKQLLCEGKNGKMIIAEVCAITSDSKAELPKKDERIVKILGKIEEL